MKRFCYLAMLMMLSSSAHAGNSFSFVVGGHRIQIESSRHCDSPSCVSVSIPGVYETGRHRDRDDDRLGKQRDARQNAAAPVMLPAPAPVCAPPAATKPSAETVASIPVLPTTVQTPAPAVAPPVTPIAQQVAAPIPVQPAPVQPPSVQPSKPVEVTAPPPPVRERPAEAARPSSPPPRVSRVSHELEDEPTDTPLGDWQTEGNKGAVRIERCGQALCGYLLNLTSNAKGETILIDMKPKTVSEWSGNIYSRDSGNTYYATIAMKGPNSLRVEACALGRFFCSGNIWSRIDLKPMRTVTTRQILSGT